MATWRDAAGPAPDQAPADEDRLTWTDGNPHFSVRKIENKDTKSVLTLFHFKLCLEKIGFKKKLETTRIKMKKSRISVKSK